jgi:hypothetical protein
MTAQIGAVRRALKSIAGRRILGRCASAAIGAALGAISVSVFGADLATESSQAIRTEHRPITAQPSALPDTKLDHLAAHAPMVDRLYEELMHWTPPGCSSTSNYASMGGAC